MPIELPDGARWLARNWQTLRQYNFEWVAATREGLVFHAPDLDDVIARVAFLQRQRDAVYAFVDFEEEVRR